MTPRRRSPCACARRRPRVPCPLCATPARRIHSRYERTLADLPWAQYRVRLQLRVRKWFCRNPRLRAPHLHRTAAHRRGPLGAAHPAAGPAPRRPRRGPGGHGRGASRPRVGPGREPEHPAAPAPPAAAARRCPRPGCWGWTISPCANGTPMARSWWTWNAASPWPCSRSAPPSRWRSGSGSTPGWR